MRRVRFCAALIIALATNPLAVPAQPYPASTPVPRSTDPAVLRRLIVARELHERFARGLAAEDRGAWADAADEFERIIALAPPEPANSTARYDAAIAEAHLGHYDRAQVRLEEALARDPGFAAAAANLVSVAIAAGDRRAARSAADRFVTLVPASARARYERGLLALDDGDLETAAGDFRALLADDPAYAIAHYDLGLVEVRSNRLDAAEAEFQRAVALSPGYARARFALGTVLVRQGRRAEARAVFDRAAHDASDPALHDLALTIRDQL